MFTSIPSLDPVLQCLLPVFTQPSFQTHVEVLLGWVMCLSKRTEYGVFQTIQADTLVSRKERHPFDRFYNFFSRSAWTVHDLAHQVAVAIVVRLNPSGLLYLVVDDTLLHKRGKHVYGLGWFRDAVASTAKRVATASGNHWVVVGLAICIPGTSKIYCLPIHAMLHLAGKNQKSEATLAKQMLDDILQWFPDRKLVFIGDGAYSANNLLDEMNERVTYVGVMRSDAEIYTPTPPKQPKSKRGPKPKKGPRLPNPREAMKRADRNRSGNGYWTWQTVEATAYGVTRSLQVISFPAVWPKVLELVPILVVLVRDPEGKFLDKYLFTTNMNADLSWVISTFSRRWSIEVAFKSSKQVMKIQAPQHWCQQSIEKLSPWVWLMQSVISLWYIT
ncbi:MAG: transposase, partial [Proteobacteria bacterium]|nr:transposase [Pseudomonadota bacterium]